MNGKPVAVTRGAVFSSVTNSSQQVSGEMLAGKLYQFASSTNCYISQGSVAQTAQPDDDNLLCPANTPLFIHGSNGAYLSVIRVTADGFCTLHHIQEI